MQTSNRCCTVSNWRFCRFWKIFKFWNGRSVIRSQSGFAPLHPPKKWLIVEGQPHPPWAFCCTPGDVAPWWSCCEVWPEVMRSYRRTPISRNSIYSEVWINLFRDWARFYFIFSLMHSIPSCLLTLSGRGCWSPCGRCRGRIQKPPWQRYRDLSSTSSACPSILGETKPI